MRSSSGISDRQTAITVSDRLHVLILASLGGAVPGRLPPSPASKVREHFAAVGYKGVSMDSATADAVQLIAFLRGARGRSPEVRRVVLRAQAMLDELERLVLDAVSERGARRSVARLSRRGRSMSEAPTRPRAESLGRSAARGGLVTLAGQGVRALVQVASIVVLARLVTPADYGYVAMVGAIVGAASILQDFGLSRAAVQAPTITPGQRDNLFWLDLGCGAVASVIVVAGAPAVAALYGEPLLVDITRWLAVTFLLGGIAAQFRASLMRDLRFTAIALVDVIAPTLGLLVAIGVALLDGSYWALVAQQIVAAATICVGSVIIARWLPGLPHGRESVRPFVSYGVHQLGAQLLTYFSMNADAVMVGARFGAAPAGLYDRAFRMMMLPVRQLQFPITRVAMPVLSRLQDDAENFGRFVVRGQTILLNLLAPVMMLGAAVAGPVVEVVLGSGGSRWRPSSRCSPWAACSRRRRSPPAGSSRRPGRCVPSSGSRSGHARSSWSR